MITLLVLGIAGPWFVFIAVAEDIWESGGFIGDQPLLMWVHQQQSPSLDQVALILTYIGGPWVIGGATVAIGGVLLWRHHCAKTWFFVLSMGGAMLFNLLAKVIFGRPRPALWASIAPAKFYSFPSGHAMGSAALAAALVFLLWDTHWRWTVVCSSSLFALGVGLSRVYLGVHYPSDVLAGWVCSLGWVASLHVFFSPDWAQLRQWWRAGIAYWQ
ncbi:phosphatase PAP2 family protein [Hymenobacter sp. NBH84]|uniref:phosphatase PAP2 family protein n=1 Tax=Hymenobacter sp. NBH84 TaxID=2596915 RepID=UPI001624704C|nr:phosphatase PAP2 family protein [Hymenobacter sp. NBH84]